MSLLLLQKKFQPRNIPDLQLWLDANRIGVQGYSLDFDGTDDFVQADNVITAYPFTLECWVRLDVVNVNQRILGIANTTTNDIRYGIALNVSTTKYTVFAQNNSPFGNDSTTTALANVWTHIAAVFTSATSRTLYVNGVLEATGTDNVTFDNSGNNKVNIGRHFTTGAFLNGKLSDVRIWNTARTAQQIADNYQRRLNGNESGLVGYWKLDKGSGTTVEDSTSNANTGTINGAIWDNSEPLTEAISDNTAVRVWADQSGNAYNAEQSTSAARPTYRTNQLNGLPAVVFDGTDDRLSLVSGALGMLRNVGGATVFAVVNIATSALDSAPLYFGTNTNNFRILIRKNTTNKIETYGRRLDADSFQNVTSNFTVNNNYIIHSAIFNYQQTLLQQFINGLLDGQKTDFQTAGNTSDTDSSSIRIGDHVTLTRFLNGAIAEIIVYNRALNTSELAQVHRYLARKWGIQLA